MLTNILPGLRELRAPLVAGSLLLASLYLLLVESAEPALQPNQVDPRLLSLHELIGRHGWFVVAAIGAYLVGSIYMGLRNIAIRGIASRMVPRVTRESYQREGGQAKWEAILAPFSRPSVRRLGLVLSDQHDEELARQLCRDIIFGGGKRLLVANKELFGEYDRLQSEADFRDAATGPALLFAALAIVNLHLSFTVGLAMVSALLAVGFALFCQGRALDREAYSLHGHAVADGVVSTASLESRQRELEDRRPAHDLGSDTERSEE